jgi:CRP/FNR family cyclic AMP-dependent transcriptional regulator
VRESGAEFAFLPDRSAADWEKIIERCESRRFDAGATIAAAGEVDRSLLIHIRGTVGVVLAGADRPFKEIAAPSVLGEVAFLDGGPRSVTLIALDECEALRLTMDSFEVLSAHDPEIGRAILLDLGRILAARLRLATDLLGGG